MSKVVVVVAVVVGAVGFGPASPSARAAAPATNAKSYVYDVNHNTGTVGPLAGGLPQISPIGALRAGNIAVDALAGDLQIIGADLGGNTVYKVASGDQVTSFEAFDGGTTGVTVAVGNLDADSANEIVAGQETGGSHVRVFDESGGAFLSQFDAYEPGFTGGVRLAVGDVNGDGSNEIIVAPGPGRAPTLKAFTPAGALVASTDAYATTFLGGVFVAAAQLDSDATVEVVTGAGQGGGPHVRLFNGLTPEGAGFFSFDSGAAHDGVRVGAGPTNGVPTIVAVTRNAANGVIRTFNPDGSAQTPLTNVAGSDGDLSMVVAHDRIWMYDAAPRLISVSPQSVLDHTRPTLTVEGASLGALGDDVNVGDANTPVFVTDFGGTADVFTIDIQVAARAPAGAIPVTVATRSPGGSLTHNLMGTFNIGTRPNALRDLITTGVGSGGGPHVRTFTGNGPIGGGYFAGSGSESSGVRVARGDLDGDGVDEIVTASGPGQPPVVREWSASGALIREINAYDLSFSGGVYVAVGDVDGHAGMELIAGADAGGGPHVKVFDRFGGDLDGFFAYGPEFHGGVRVAAADVDGDGFAEVVTAPGPGGGPHIRAFLPNGEAIESFFAYDPRFTGGVFVAGADIDGDGVDEIITGPGAGGGPHVRAFGPNGPLGGGFMAFAPDFTGGVSVGRVGDEILGPDLIAVGAGPGGGPHVKLFNDAGHEVQGFYAYDPKFTGGVFVAGGLV